MDHHSHPTDHTHIHTRPHGTDEIIVCRDVHKWYGEFEALKGVSMTVKRGEVVVIIGPSGSGRRLISFCPPITAVVAVYRSTPP